MSADPSIILTVEGEIGAGKTALVSAMAAALRARGARVCEVPEPVDRWRASGALEAFYGDPARHAYGFQTFVFATRVLAIASAVEACPDADVYLLERSPATDRVFMELQQGVVSPVELAMYAAWCDAWQLMLPLDLGAARVLYLKPSLPVCMARTACRGRAGEVAGRPEPEAVVPGARAEAAVGVTLAYQARLRRAHEAFFQGRHAGEFPGLPASPFASVVEAGPDLADGNFRDAGPERDRIVAAILAKLGFP